MSQRLGEERSCTRCALALTRRHVVAGRGNGQADVLVLGEAPGRAEDKTGLGFQGAAGRQFEEILAFVGLTRDAIWLANAVRCRPSVGGTRNRAPTREELDACRTWLASDIARVRPRVVVTLGRLAFESVAGRRWDVRYRAEPLAAQAFDVTVFALYHPAYLIYRRSLVGEYRQDLIALRQYLSSQGIPLAARTGAWQTETES